MKNNIKNLTLVVATIFLSACNLDYFPNDEVSVPQMTKTYEGLCTLTDGNYATLKADMEYKGSSSTSYTFVRRGLEMLEFSADEVFISGRTSSTIWQAYTMEHTDALQNVQYVWWNLYYCIMGANSVMESITDETDVQMAYLKGENYFLRAFCHLMLCNLYAWPYSHNEGKEPGVVLRLSSGAADNLTRATVGECYDQIEKDLKEAIRLMSLGGKRRGNNGYASKEAAQGLLTRVYLHMGKNQECVDLVNEMLGGADASSKLTSTEQFPTYFANTLTYPETLWCIAYTPLEGADLGKSLYAGMIYKDAATDAGWGEAFTADPLLDLFERYPEDLRYSVYILPQVKDPSTYKVRYPVPGEDYRAARSNASAKATKVGDEFQFKAGDATVTTFTEIENTYPVRYAMIDGQKTRVRVTPTMDEVNTFPRYYCTKFSFQDGNAMLASPSFVRWGELILNRAEAYAKLEKTDLALADVNAIRKRAGIREDGMFTMDNMKKRGYPTALDVVLDERHLELAYEGFRTLDLIRNKRDIDRQYAGIHTWEVVKYNDPKILYPIPFDEVSVSHIEQNQLTYQK